MASIPVLMLNPDLFSFAKPAESTYTRDKNAAKPGVKLNQVYCPHCKASMKRHQYQAHLATCTKIVVNTVTIEKLPSTVHAKQKGNCPLCGVLMRVTKLKSHHAKCPQNKANMHKTSKAVANNINKKLVEEREALQAQGLVKVNGKIQRVSASPTSSKHRVAKQAATARRIKEIQNASLKSHKPSGNFKYTGEELRALAKGISLEELRASQVVAAPVASPVVRSPAPVVVEKVEESFSDKWLRLFSEKGYNVAMITAYRNAANNQGIKYAEQNSFLEVVKPGKKSVNENVSQIAPVGRVEAPVSVSKAVVAPNLVERPVERPRASERVLDTHSKGVKVERSVKVRDAADQADFAKRVNENYSYRCALTGDSVALQACHIETHSDHYDNSTDNGILLSASLHTLFDKGILVIDAETMTAHFTQDCFFKKHLEGVKVREGKVGICKDKLKAKSF